MVYGKTEKYICAYDNKSGLTLRFEDGKWRVSPTVYAVVEHDVAGFEALAAAEAFELTNGVTPAETLELLSKVLDPNI